MVTGIKFSSQLRALMILGEIMSTTKFHHSFYRSCADIPNHWKKVLWSLIDIPLKCDSLPQHNYH